MEESQLGGDNVDLGENKAVLQLFIHCNINGYLGYLLRTAANFPIQSYLD